MVQIARCFLCAVALLFSGAPVILPVLVSTNALARLLQPGSYEDKKRDLMFVVVSILSIGVLDCFDCFISAAHPKVKIVNRYGLLLSVFIGLSLVVQLFLYATWVNSADFYTQSSIVGILYLVLIAVVCALAARATLVFGASE